jgi:hypothetical protein
VGQYDEPTTHFIREYEMEEQNNSNSQRPHADTRLNQIFNQKSENQSNDQKVSRNSKNQLFSEQNFGINSSVQRNKHSRFLTEGQMNQKKVMHELILTEEDLNGVSDEELRKKIKTMFVRDRPRFSQEIIKQCEGLMDKHGLGGEKGNLLDEFYRFCQETLPHDERYKESVLFVSMFYYFLERKKLIG